MTSNAFAHLSVLGAAALMTTAATANGRADVGLTIVSSCTANSADAYRAVKTRKLVRAAAGCTGDAGYTLTLSPAVTTARRAVDEQQTRRPLTSITTGLDANDVVVVLTY